MALIFTDDQLKKISSDIIGFPVLIASLEAQKAANVILQGSLLETDENNKIFSDNFIGIISKYHEEISALDGLAKADYSEAILLSGVKKETGNQHFPVPPDEAWIKMPPKLATENNGNPSSINADYELTRISTLQLAISKLKIGYSDGILDDTSTLAPAAGKVEVDTGGFVAGQTIVVDDSGVSFIALIDLIDLGGITLGAEVIEYTLLGGSEAGLGVGSRVRNFHSGFTNAEREGTSVPTEPEVMAYFQGIIDSDSVAWKGFLQTQEAALLANDDTGTGGTQNDTAVSKVQLAVADIVTWEAFPATGAGTGKYGNVSIAVLEARQVIRNSEAPARATEVGISLGSVVQDAEGAVVSNGSYGSLWIWVDLRINLGAGSLTKFLTSDLGLVFFDQLIVGAQNQEVEYSNIFLVKTVTVDGTGDEFLTVNDTAGLNLLDTVKVMDNDSAVLPRQIVDIQGNVLEFDIAIGVPLVIGKLARVVKEL